MTDAADRPPPPTTPAAPSRARPIKATLAVMAAVVIATFFRLLRSDFSWWDDQQTLHHNPYFNPPTVQTLARYWSAPFMGLYVPVTYTLWTAIAKLAYIGSPDEFNISLNPWLFHAANLALHLVSTGLVFALLRRLFAGDVTAACLGALLFALHPFQVESLGWISGMKDLLCWCATLAAILLYTRRAQSVARRPAPLWRGWELPAAALLMTIGILSKPSAIVAPAAMLAIDGLAVRRRWARPAMELAPLFALSLAGGILARVVQTVATADQVASWRRPLVVGDAYAFYLVKLAWPFSMGLDYGRTPAVILADRWTIVRSVLPATLAVALFVCRRRVPTLALAGVIFAIGISPVSGIAPFQMQEISTTADHYVYFAMLGPAIALAWALTRWPGRAGRAAAVALLAALAVRSFDQCKHWADTFALFDQAVRVNPRSTAVQNNLASVHMRRLAPRYDLAEHHARLAKQLKPDDYYSLQTWGIIESELGHSAEAIAAFDRLWALSDHYQVAPTYRVDISQTAYDSMCKLHEFDRAAVWARRQIEWGPQDYRGRANLAWVERRLEADRAATRPSTRSATTAR